MTTEEILFCLLKNEICGTDFPPDFDLTDKTGKLYRLSKQHDIAHLIGDALFRNKLLPESRAQDAFKEQIVMAVYRYENQTAEFKRISDALNEAKIEYIPLKGSVIRNYYPEPWMRTSCDIDILVKKDKFFDASEYLIKKLNYKRDNYGSHDVSLYSSNNVHIELHYSLIEENWLYSVENILKNVWDYAFSVKRDVEYALSDEMFYFYHIAHMVKHFISGGCGIRPFIDLWLLNHKRPFDKNTRNALLEEGGLLKFSQVCENLSEVWLNGSTHDDTTALLQDFILNGGVYGNLKNRALIYEKTTPKKKIWSYIWKPYNELKYWYPRLAKHKWLLPFYEIKRWFTIVFCGPLSYKFKEKNILNKTEKEKRVKTDKLISDLGLK